MRNNLMIECFDNGMMNIYHLNTAEEAIRNAKISIRESAKLESITLTGIIIEFADNTTAVWNKAQKSECLMQRNAPPSIVG